MQTKELMAMLDREESLIVTLARQDIPRLKARLSNYKTRNKDFLGDERRLEFVTLPPNPGALDGTDPKDSLVRLRISLITPDTIPVVEVTKTEEF